MDNQRILKISKISKELMDLNSDKERLLRICKFGNSYELEQCLQEMYFKYFVQGVISGVIGSNPAPTLQEQVNVCLNFLDSLILNKSGELTLETAKEINNVLYL